MGQLLNLNVQEQVLGGFVLGNVDTVFHLHWLVEVLSLARMQDLVEHAVLVREVGVEAALDLLQDPCPLALGVDRAPVLEH